MTRSKCARSPRDARELQALANERVRIHKVDVTDAASVRALADSLRDTTLDMLFNVAGVYGGPCQSLAQMADDLELRDVADTFEVNAIGPLVVHDRARSGASTELDSFCI